MASCKHNQTIRLAGIRRVPLSTQHSNRLSGKTFAMETDLAGANESGMRKASTIESLRDEIERLEAKLEDARKPSPSSDKGSQRRFGIGDCVFLVAATASGLAVTRTLAPGLTPNEVWDQLWLSVDPSVRTFTIFVAVLGNLNAWLIMPNVATWTLACLLMHLRTTCRFARRPGAMACLAATVTMFIPVGLGLISQNILTVIALGSVLIGIAVFWCWMTMAFCGQWEAASTWLDRTAQFIGALWILAAVTYAYIGIAIWPY